MKSCQSLLAGSVLATLLLASGVWAQGPSTDVLVSGERGRSYHEFGSNLVKLLPAFRLENRISSGSVENLGLLADGKADLRMRWLREIHPQYGSAIRRFSQGPFGWSRPYGPQ